MKKATAATQKIKSLIYLGKTNVEIMNAIPKATLAQIYNQRYLRKKNLQHVAAVVTGNRVESSGEHRKDKLIDLLDVIHNWELGYFEGNIVKYVSRWKAKGNVEELLKARSFLDKLLAIEQAGGL